LKKKKKKVTQLFFYEKLQVTLLFWGQMDFCFLIFRKEKAENRL